MLKVKQAVGNVGKDPIEAETSVGPVVRFSVAQTMSYPDVGQQNGETRWINVAVFKPSIRAQVMAQIKKGSRVAVEGVVTESTWNGLPQFGMKASRVGLVEWFMPSDEDKAAAQQRMAEAKPVSTDDEGDW